MGDCYSICFLRWQVNHSESAEFVLDTSGKFVQYDTLNSDPKYLNLEAGKVAKQESVDRTSPVSVGTSSVSKLHVASPARTFRPYLMALDIVDVSPA